MSEVTIIDVKTKIKDLLKDHKKEIAIAVGAAGVTSFLYTKFGKTVLVRDPFMSVRFEAGLDRSLRFGSDEDGKKFMSGHTFMDLDLKDLKVSDLGNAGKKLQQMFPGLKSDTPLRRVSMDYNFKV